jgi:hypothetical protein
MTPRSLLPLAALALCSSCVVFDSSTKVTLASDPPGARVLIDERDSGFVTPCVLELDPTEATRMELVLPGYETAKRLLLPDLDAQVVLWRDMYLRGGVPRAPFWLNTRDLFEPFKFDKRLSPSRVFVRLERTADK